MTHWRHTLNISEAWQRAKDDELSIQELANIISSRLSGIKFNDDDLSAERNDLCEAFDDLAADDDATEDEFNSLMSELYDFGDMRLKDGSKVMWIRTMY